MPFLAHQLYQGVINLLAVKDLILCSDQGIFEARLDDVQFDL